MWQHLHAIVWSLCSIPKHDAPIRTAGRQHISIRRERYAQIFLLLGTVLNRLQKLARVCIEQEYLAIVTTHRQLRSICCEAHAPDRATAAAMLLHSRLACIARVHNDTAVFAWDGRTYGFRARFDQALIPRIEENLRVLPEDMRNFDVATNGEHVVSIFGNLVLRDLVCCVRLTGQVLPQDGPVADLIADLKTKSNLFFDAF